MPIGLQFYVEGKYRIGEDVDGDWLPFTTEDIHPDREDRIVIMSNATPSGLLKNDPDTRQLFIDKAVTVVDWMRFRQHCWDGFNATLYLDKGRNGNERVYDWNQA